MKRITANDFRDYRRDRFIDAQTSAEVTLAPTSMLTNEMGVSSEHPETVSNDIQSKVVFDIMTSFFSLSL